VLIRREVPSDRPAVRAVHEAAFARPDGGEVAEATLTDALRTGPWWIPQLSLVAVDPSGTVAGHVIATRGDVGGRPALGLGPLGVLPARQGDGVGSALMHAVLAAAEAMDELLVALLGEPAYYARFGFVPAAEAGVAAPEPAWGRYFQVRVFSSAAPSGTFRYAAPFDAVS